MRIQNLKRLASLEAIMEQNNPMADRLVAVRSEDQLLQLVTGMVLGKVKYTLKRTLETSPQGISPRFR